MVLEDRSYLLTVPVDVVHMQQIIVHMYMGDMTHGEVAILPAFIMLLKFNLAILFIQEHTGSLL